MAPISDTSTVKKHFLIEGEIVSLLISLLALSIITCFFILRWQKRDGSRIPVALVILLPAYVIHYLYIFTLTMVIHLRFEAVGLCDAPIMTCLTLYVLSKASVFIVLIERAYIISWSDKPRYKHVEYVLSTGIIVCAYTVATGMCIWTRVAFYNEHRVCIIGMALWALIFLSVVEVSAYSYLTLRFLIPILLLQYQNNGLLAPLRRAMLRTAYGAILALASTIGTKVLVGLFNGVPAWLCCLACKCDAFLSICVLHWITQTEKRKAEAPDSPVAYELSQTGEVKQKGKAVKQDSVVSKGTASTAVEEGSGAIYEIKEVQDGSKEA